MWKPTFSFKESSPFRVMSEPQQRMVQAIGNSEGQSGLVVAPCGSGKSAVLIDAAMKAGTLVLIFCYESQGVKQIAKDLRTHTSLLESQICTYTGKDKKKLNSRFCYLVTTYGMFAGPVERRNQGSRDVRDFVFETKWDLICCDEAHHVCAETYKPMIQGLKAKRKLGFTATPYRSELFSVAEERDEHIRKAFEWFGEVLVRITWSEVENAGLVAKIGRARVDVELTPEFRKAYDMALGSQKKYIAALNPAKLNALVAVCAWHRPLNHGGIIFVTHLLAAQLVKRLLERCFGQGWEVLSGGSAWGEDATHSADKNEEIVNRFNRGELRGLVCTNVAAGAMDIPDCAYAVDLDTDGGRANTVQRHGRAARTDRVHAQPGECPEALRARRLEKQKEAWYYDLVTRDTEDVTAARLRSKFFRSEGYGRGIRVAPEELRSGAVDCGVEVPYNSLARQMELLMEVLQYTALKDVCAEANAVVTKARKPHSAEVKRLKQRQQNHPNPLFKARIGKEVGRAEQAQRAATAKAKDVRRHVIDSAPLNQQAREIFRKLNLDMGVLEEIGLVDVAFAPSDDSGGAGD